MDKSSGHIFLSEPGVIGLNTQLVEIPSASYTSTLALDSIISPREEQDQIASLHCQLPCQSNQPCSFC